MKILVINSGSSSLKYQLIDTNSQDVLLKGLVDRVGNIGATNTYTLGGEKFKEDVLARDHKEAIGIVVKIITTNNLLVEAIGHRVVHGGHKFFESVLIDEEVIEYIREFGKLAPLHNPPNLIGILACQEILKDIPQVAVFDTAFHQTIPPDNYFYAIPYKYYENYRIRKYGFHGTSHRYVTQKTAELLGINIDNINLITCHLGNGASITAVRNGKSYDTSMGFTPLEGLIMGTRSGDIDPSIPLFIMDKENISTSEMDRILNKESGILGITGLSNDMRIIEEEYEKGNERAVLAFNMYCNRIRKYIGAYFFMLGRVDGIVFTAGVGENSPLTRKKVLSGLENIGIEIDDEANNRTIRGQSGIISTSSSKIKVVVMPTNEELAIALDTERVVLNTKSIA
ncbi:MAG: acetate kinase [Spirochaetia bacterium]|nr:acetate kinase [Spirochaetota bacterium]MCX8096960.1 acetate kinase [Spirochaetota bacterium]MDW8112399.1 acetate kinase [Spirochaetia bacterium]